MGQYFNIRTGACCLLAALLTLVASPGTAEDADLYLAGLGMHQETGRNIYLGGIYLERELGQPDDFTRSRGTRVMEYRVIARRTSLRSLLGGMLLQSEVATGRAPDAATTDFADALLSSVNTSLYAGDSLQVEATNGNETVARLNGHELARIAGTEVADYLLMGWVGESGPSTVFRNTITARDIDPALRDMLETRTYSAEREAEVAAWLGNSPQPPAPAGAGQATPTPQLTAAEAAPKATQDSLQDASGATAPATVQPQEAETTAPAQSTEPPGTIAAAPESGTAATADAAQKERQETGETQATPVAANTSRASASPAITITTRDAAPAATLSPISVQASRRIDSDPAAHTLAEANQEDGEAVQVASLFSPGADMLPRHALEDHLSAIGVQAYSQRLSRFHTNLVRKVYGQIHYPKRAVRRALEGRLELDVTLTAEGDLVGIAVATTSGHQLLDEAAIAAAQDAFEERLQSIDPVAVAEFGSFTTGELVIPIPVSFQLQ